MPKNSWTIGSDSSCDLVVNSNMVSGHHCRLTSDGNDLTLTDLNSTNGTYVNGGRLLGSRRVRTSDTITLGQSHPMPWPESIKRSDLKPIKNHSTTKAESKTETILSIGRGPDNAVVLSDSNVSTHHARLTIEGDEMVLEDLGSTNGTSIGEVENKISRGRVQRTDTVFFGSKSYRVSDLINRSQSTFVAPTTRSETVASSKSKPPMAGGMIALATVGIGVLLLIWAGGLVTREPNPNQTAQSVMPSSAPKAPDTTVKIDAGQAAVINSPGKPAATDPSETTVDLSPEEQFTQSLFLIVCADARRETPFRVGTGFAIDAETIVTSASVIQAMRSLQQNGYTEAFLFSPTSESELKIVSAVTHPQFQIAERAAREAQQTHDAIYDQLESQPPEPEAFEAVKDRLIASRLQALKAMDQKATYDVAIINTAKPFPHWLPIASDETKLRPNQKINVTGYAFDMEDPYFDSAAPLELSTINSRIGQLVTTTNSASRRVLAKGNTQQYEYAYLGSPVLNTQGQVVGVYSRPIPNDIESEDEPMPSFDAALFTRILECRSSRQP